MKIFVVGLLLVVCILCEGLLFYQYDKRNPEFKFKGKTYVVAGLQGAGYTRQHRSPVYTLVVMAKEDSTKWTKS